jgi:hypothetical protein
MNYPRGDAYIFYIMIYKLELNDSDQDRIMFVGCGRAFHGIHQNLFHRFSSLETCFPSPCVVL